MLHFLPDKNPKPAGRRIAFWTLSLGFLIAMSLIWRFTPLNEWLAVDNLVFVIEAMQHSVLAPLFFLAAFIVAGLVMIPITLLIIATVVFFGAWPGLMYALVGSTACALSAYGIGHRIGRRRLIELTGERFNRVSQRIARQGLLTVILVRIVPVAPFTIINLVAGASHIRFRDFFLGTVIGLLPALLAITLLTDRIKATIETPNVTTITTVIVLALVVIGVGIFLSRFLLAKLKPSS